MKNKSRFLNQLKFKCINCTPKHNLKPRTKEKKLNQVSKTLKSRSRGCNDILLIGVRLLHFVVSHTAERS